MGRFMKLETRNFDPEIEEQKQNDQVKFGQTSDIGENFRAGKAIIMGENRLPCQIAGYVPELIALITQSSAKHIIMKSLPRTVM